jgi:hypothetical protein
MIITIIVTSVSYSYIRERHLQSLLRTKEAELLKGDLILGRATTQLKDSTSTINLLNKQIKNEIQKRNAVVNLYGELQARYNTSGGPVKIITRVVYKNKLSPNPVLSLDNNKIYIKLNDSTLKEVTSMGYSYNDFRITIFGDAVKETLEYKLHQKFKAIFVETTLPQGSRNHYAEVYELDENNKPIGKMELTKFDVIRTEELQSHWFWWNPKVDLHIGAGITNSLMFNWVADLGLSISSYGRTVNDLTWRFFRLGTGITSKDFSLTFSPAQLNIGQFLPLISNLWVLPYIGHSFPAMDFYFGMGISVVL